MNRIGTFLLTTFIHAGAVAYRGRTIVMPGKSFAGKTVLVTGAARGLGAAIARTCAGHGARPSGRGRCA